MVSEHMVNPFLFHALEKNLPGYTGTMISRWNHNVTMCTITVHMVELLDETVGDAKQKEKTKKKNQEAISKANEAAKKLKSALKKLAEGYFVTDFQFEMCWGARVVRL
jgi:hypothetical protein